MNTNADIPSFEAAASAARRKDYALALDIATRLLVRNPKDANALQVIGFVYGKQGRHQEALAAFQRADAIAPNQAPILNSIGAMLRERGDLAGARAALEKALRLNPSLIEALYGLAGALTELGERDLARQSYENAVRLNPRNAEAIGKLARFLEEDHKIDDARAAAERALAIDPQNANAHITLAAIDAREGKHAAVFDRVTPLLRTGREGPINRATLCGALARALEKLKRYDESFSASAEANSVLHAHYAEQIAQRLSPLSPANIDRLIAHFEHADAGAWTKHDFAEPSPVFLVGFPRSGTTLLDQILSSHSGVAVLEEKDTLYDAAVDVVLAEGGLERLASLSREEVDRFRSAYWGRVRSHLPAGADGKRVIDKAPLNTALLCLVYRLFPDAKIIFALRDPRDAVLSCFQQTFGLNVAMYQFLKLDTAARYYDLVMRLGSVYREKLPLRVHEIRYENVVSDLKAELAPLLAFLGIKWNDQMERYYETARERVIRTPSAKQVIEKPYQSSIGKWRHYEKQMQPVLPTLEPWVRAFEYT